MNYTQIIDAPREKVWKTLWEDATYRQWTAPFSEGSRAETDWKKGSKILFLDGNGAGMVSRVEENIPNEYMGITHIGVVANGVEDYDSEEVKQWIGAFENYTLKDKNGATELLVELGGATIPEEFVVYMEKTWPVALEKLKEIAEK